MRYVMLYDYVPDVGDRIMPHLDAHLKLIHDFHQRELLLMGGQLLGTDSASAMGVFATRKAAQQFVDADPLVAEGIVTRWQIADYDDVLQ